MRGKTDYFPIPFIKELINISHEDKYLQEIHSSIRHLKVNSASSKIVKATKTLDENISKIIGAFMADGSLTVTIIFASKNKDNLQTLKSDLDKQNIIHNQWYCGSRKEHNVSTTLNYKNQENISTLIKNYDKKINIQSHYNIEITDEHKSNLECFKKWMENYFDILPNSFKKKQGGWRLIYSNKIVARYFMNFFQIIPGPKTHIAFEPEIIKKSTLEIRKLFARGVLMFDGSFSTSGKIYFSTISKSLFQSIKDILKQDGIKIGTTENRNSFTIYSYENNLKEKYLHYFEKDTCKWRKIKDSYEIRNRSIEELDSRYKVHSNNKIIIKKLYELINEKKSCDWNYLVNYFNCSRHLIKPYLLILRNSNLIRFTNKPLIIKYEYISNLTKVYLKEELHKFIFDKIKETFGTYDSFSKQTGIHKATISAWKLGKSKIELDTLKRFCNICNINFSIVLNNIQQTDRMIIEIS